ncbi:bacteriophage Mu Gam like protein [Roseibium sp. TrichSKD4]|uniref:host-nuclease inhibitor Gam family protein n=1 Tax=Roseibium sp. TrichSKD4 TaxID=744980 RepID=UPI0001E56D37|nr:host-nuclease inhibitor Gam family protein [Roseibium sp. TrichSKD4]EFO33248.1 bacteriophage Mu Gam like protein [Roseibium sp. TrichSKD4]
MSQSTKKLTGGFIVPQSKEECDDMIRQLGELNREAERIKADMNDELALVKERFEKQAAPVKSKAKELLKGIETWCAANRDSLTGGKVKFAKFMNGEIAWRVRPPRVVCRSIDAALAALREHGLEKFIRTKEEINKEAILEDPNAVFSVSGITVKSAGEDFQVKPFETELNGEAA